MKDEALASPKDEALKLALEALESSNNLINGTGNHFGLEGAMDGYYSGCFDVDGNNKLLNKAIAAIKAAMAQGETSSPRAAQEPVALVIDGVLVKSALPEKYTGHLYTTPPTSDKINC